ncbi:MAG: ACT domain-containing protein [Candidatus Sulfomarinibacteraceae bacterium]
MDAADLTLDLLADELAVCRLPVDAAIPNWAWSGELTSITSSDNELSVVCAADPVPDDVQHAPGWRAFRVRGPLDFGLVGILAGLSTTLADAGISIFAISTYDTDYLLVRNEQLEAAVEALTAAGYPVRETRESL